MKLLLVPMGKENFHDFLQFDNFLTFMGKSSASMDNKN